MGLIIISYFLFRLYYYLKKPNDLFDHGINSVFLPIVRIELLILYYWAAFNKLNHDFFDDIFSCAKIELFYLSKSLPILTDSEFLLHYNPYITIFIELLIPTLLLFSKLRIFGVLAGLIFHFFLSFGHTGFSVFAYGCLIIFISSQDVQILGKYYRDFKYKINKICSIPTKYEFIYCNKISLMLIEVLSIFLLYKTLNLFLSSPIDLWMMNKKGLFIIISLIVLVAFILVIYKKYKDVIYSTHVNIVPKYRIFLIFPVLFFINGFLPHLGVKNIQVLAMYSNLKTEGGSTNHYILPSSMQVFDNLNDLVEIKSSNIRGLDKFNAPVTTRPIDCTIHRLPKTYIEYLHSRDINISRKYKFYIPYIQLQNVVTELRERGVKNIEIEFYRNGKYYNITNAEHDPQLAGASIFQRKLLCMRAVPQTTNGMCLW